MQNTRHGIRVALSGPCRMIDFSCNIRDNWSIIKEKDYKGASVELLRHILRDRKGLADQKASMQDVIDNLRLLSKGEKQISEFYQLCGNVLADEKDFWHDLAASEREHAEVALKMADLVAKEPGKYKPGRSFDVVSIRLFGLHVDGLVASMRAGKIKKDELLSLAADIEISVVEMNYGDIVKTDVPEFRALARKLAEDTREHRQTFEKKMQ